MINLEQNDPRKQQHAREKPDDRGANVSHRKDGPLRVLLDNGRNDGKL